VGLIVAVHTGEGEAVIPNVGLSVGDSTLTVGTRVRVGGSTIPAEVGIGVAVAFNCTDVGEEVRVGPTGVGVRAPPERVRVGVGVGRKTPGTTRSAPPTCPSSRRIASNTAGFIGATTS
jgi:hypothetical protein